MTSNDCIINIFNNQTNVPIFKYFTRQNVSLFCMFRPYVLYSRRCLFSALLSSSSPLSLSMSMTSSSCSFLAVLVHVVLVAVLLTIIYVMSIAMTSTYISYRTVDDCFQMRRRRHWFCWSKVWLFPNSDFLDTTTVN